MAKCKAKDCTAQAVTKSGLCDKHRRAEQAALLLAQQKEQAAKALKEREAKQLEMARLAKEKEEKLKAKATKINTIAADWNGKVKAVVQQVKNLRAHNPTVHGINAGNNAVGNTPGGTDNPIALTLPSDAKDIIKADVFSKMAGFDSSDSGLCKIRIQDPAGNILIHVK